MTLVTQDPEFGDGGNGLCLFILSLAIFKKGALDRRRSGAMSTAELHAVLPPFL